MHRVFFVKFRYQISEFRYQISGQMSDIRKVLPYASPGEEGFLAGLNCDFSHLHFFPRLFATVGEALDSYLVSTGPQPQTRHLKGLR